MFLEIQLILTCFGNIITKVNKEFPRLHLQTCFYCYHGILNNNDHLPNRQSLLRTADKISWPRFLRVSVLKQRQENYSSLSKQKPCHGAISSRLDHIRMALTEILNNCGLKRGAVCQIMRCFCPLFSEITQAILKTLSQHGLMQCS